MLLPFALWGTAMAAMKPLLDGAGPLTLAWLRLLPAGLLLLLAASLWRGGGLPGGLAGWRVDRRDWGGAWTEKFEKQQESFREREAGDVAALADWVQTRTSNASSSSGG